MTYGKRLAQAIDAKKTTRRKLADYIGCSPQILGMVISGAGKTERKLSTDNHAKAVDFLRVSDKWLLHGDGEMFEISQSNLPLALIDKAQAAINFVDAVHAIAEHLQAVDASTSEMVMSVLTRLAQHPEEHDRIGRAAQAVLQSGKQRAA
jgi:transcriptional regulator with XRE-family HTH domain